MRILSKDFVEKFKGKIINIHPSLLPKHKGLNTHNKAINSGDKHSGCTVHHINDKIDDGEIIAQQKVIIATDDTAETLKEKVLDLEHKLYPKVIKALLS
jgi:formyltetrahydrofolate-dependent phosphoribosylglycinamide formyltransferase